MYYKKKKKRTNNKNETRSDYTDTKTRKRILDHLSPTALLNTDDKIFTKLLAKRLKEGLDEMISETQSGFMKGRLFITTSAWSWILLNMIT